MLIDDRKFPKKQVINIINRKTVYKPDNLLTIGEGQLNGYIGTLDKHAAASGAGNISDIIQNMDRADSACKDFGQYGCFEDR